MSLVEYMDNKFYAGYGSQWDDVLFRKFLLKKINRDFVCLDYGAGRGKVKQLNLREFVNKVVGVDIDDAVFENPLIEEAKRLEAPDFKIPYDNDLFDLVFSDNVFEHVEFPESVFKEIYRVLKPGGLFIAKTPNKFHYMPIIARFTPLSFHKFYNKLRGRDSVDTFPTFYRCNSKYDVKKYAFKAKFSDVSTSYWEGRPEYLRLSFITYIPGMLYERIVNATGALSIFRSVLVFELKK